MSKKIAVAKNAIQYQFEFVNDVIQNYLPNKLGKVLEQGELLKIKERYEVLNHNWSGIYGVISFVNHNYIFITDSVSILDADKDALLEQGLSYVATLFHPDERGIIVNEIFPEVIRFLGQSYTEARLKDARATFTTRIRMKTGEYRWFIHQMSIIDSDNDNTTLLALKYIMEIEGIKTDNNLDLVLSLKDADNVYHPLHETSYIINDNRLSLSKRELEVLKLISEGKTSKQIASMLSLSEHTVNNHRKNMLKKSDANSISELIFNATAGKLL